MAEVNQYVFSHREVIETLIKQQGLNEGIWALGFQMGMGTSNVPAPTGGTDVVPAIIVTVLAVALQRADKEGPLALDAAKVNPAKK